MTKSFFCTLFFIFALALSSAEPEEQVSKVISLTQQKHSDAWPSLDLNDSPIVLTFSNQDIYGVNLQKPKEIWDKISLGNGAAHKAKDDLWRIRQLKLHPSYDIDGENVFVFQMGDDEESLRILAHERFHRYQLLHFAPETQKISEYTDHFNPENLALMKIEDILLKEFLEAPKEKRIELLKDYVAVNAERKKIMSESSLSWEDHQQKMEGLADYVSAKMFDGEQQILGNMGQLDDEVEDFADYAIKWRHYSAGAALAFALDFLQAKDWKTKIEKGGYLSQILENELQDTPENIKKRFNKVQRKYRFKALKKKLANKVRAFQEQLDSLFHKYQEISGPIVRLGHPHGIGISGGGSTERLISLADGTTLSILDASFSSTTDSSWKFSTSEIPFLIQNRAGFREFKIGNQCCLKLNDETISLEALMKGPPGEYPFETLVFEGEKFNFSSEKHAGVLICEGDHIAIKYF